MPATTSCTGYVLVPVLIAGLFATPCFVEGTTNMNIIGGCCARTYDSSYDYFPNKSRVDYQTGFSVEYFGSYKLVTITKTEETYVLFQRGTPQPTLDGKPDAVFIPVPIERSAVLSNAYFNYFELLGERRALVVTTKHDYLNEACLSKMVIEDGLLDGVTARDLVSNNVFATNEVDVIFRWSGSRDDALNNQAVDPKLPPVVRVDTGSATTPVGMMEWMEYVGLFFNREVEANRLVDEMKARYDCIVSFVRRQPEVRVLYMSFSLRSGVVKCSFYIGSWHRRMIEDLGGKIIGAYPGYDSNGPCNMTAFRAHAETADVWLYKANNFQEGRYGSTWSVMWNMSHEISDIAPFRNSRTFDPNGNHFRDYWASRMVELDVELEDLVTIFHPSLNYAHQRVWWLNVRTEADPGRPSHETCQCKYGVMTMKADACPGNPMTAPRQSLKPESDYGCNGELVASVCDAHPMAIACGTEPIATTTQPFRIPRIVKGTFESVVTTSNILTFVQDTKVRAAFSVGLAEACDIPAGYMQVDLSVLETVKQGRRLSQTASVMAAYTFSLPSSAPAELTTVAVARKLESVSMESLTSHLAAALSKEGFSGSSVEVVRLTEPLATMSLTDVEDESADEVEEKDKALREKKTALQEKDAALRDKNLAVQEKNTALQEKDTALQEKNTALQEKNTALQEKNAALQQKDTARQEKVAALQEKDMAEQENDDEVLNVGLGLGLGLGLPLVALVAAFLVLVAKCGWKNTKQDDSNKMMQTQIGAPAEI